MKKYPQVMTIVRNSPTEDPLITSANIPGTVGFKENEVQFLKEMLDFLENQSKELRRKADQYHDSL